MTDMFKPHERSRIMGLIRSKENRSTELRFVKLLKANKITGWRRNSTLPGRPDFIFPRERLAVFIDGDFWHGNPRKFRLPKSNCKYWKQKILGNMERDRRINTELKRRGWRVLRIWESSLRLGNRAVARVKSRLVLH